MMRVLKAGAPYYLLLIGVGLVLGVLRALWVAPRDYYWSDPNPLANLLQAPVMFLVTLVAARWIVSRLSPLPSRTEVVSVGFVSLICVVVPELAALVWYQGLRFGQYLREDLAEFAYTVMVALLALAPLGVATIGRREAPKLWSTAQRCMVSLGFGLLLTVTYHVAAGILWTFLRLPDQSPLVQVMLAPGIVLAGRGFEAQMAVVFLNPLAFLLIFSYLSWIGLKYRACRALKAAGA